MANKKTAAQTVETAAQTVEQVAPPAGFDGKTETSAVVVPATNPFASFKVAKRVTLPTINPGVNQPAVFKILDEMHVSTFAQIKPDGTKEKPATVCTIIDMVTGQTALWLVAEVCAKNLQEQYPDAGYVGKIFGVQKLPKRPGKRYFDFEIMELEAIE